MWSVCFYSRIHLAKADETNVVRDVASYNLLTTLYGISGLISSMVNRAVNSPFKE